jgi:hypothetical protein
MMFIKKIIFCFGVSTGFLLGFVGDGFALDDDYLSIGVHQLAAQKTARFEDLENGNSYKNEKPGLTQIYTQFNKSLGTAFTDTTYLHFGYTSLDIYKKSGQSIFDLNGTGVYGGMHLGRPAVLALGYESGVVKGALTGANADGSSENHEVFDGSYSSLYYQIGFQFGGIENKVFIYFLQKLMTFNTDVDLDSVSSTYDGGGLSWMTKF